MFKSLILLTNFFKNMALFACFNGLYVLPYTYMKKYNVTFTVYFDTDIKNVDTAVMADNEDMAVKIAETKLDKYLDKTKKIRSVDGFELDTVVEYDNAFHSVKLNGFDEYKPA